MTQKKESGILKKSRSPFSVLRSPFSVLRSPFSVLRSPFSVLRSPLLHCSVILLFLILALTFSACSNSSGSDPSPSPIISSVYIAGYYTNGGKKIACYWKDGVKTDLYNGTGDSEAIGVTFGSSVPGGSIDIYFTGYYKDYGGKEIACYWKNGEKTDLYSGSGNSRAAWGSLICGGYYVDGGGKEIACYWENGVKTDLYSGTGNSRATCFLAGYYVDGGGKSIACYWTWGFGGTTGLYSGTGDSKVSSVSGGFFTGSYYNSGNEIACYWKDGVKTDLYNGTGNSMTTGSYFDPGMPGLREQAVYISGAYYDGGRSIACYWKNGAKTDLLITNDSVATGIAMGTRFDGISAPEFAFYTSGYYVDGGGKTIACYWKNGIKTNLYNGAGDSYAYDILSGVQ